MSLRLAVIALTVLCARPLVSQSLPALRVEHSGWRPVVHWGKWVAAATAITFTAMGAHEHENSNRVFRQLLDMCQANNAACTLAPTGKYANTAAEQLYQTSIHYDGRARVRLLLGQMGLLASAAMFLADIRHKTTEPGNIPFHGAKLTVEAGGDATRLGVRFTLP